MKSGAPTCAFLSCGNQCLLLILQPLPPLLWRAFPTSVSHSIGTVSGRCLTLWASTIAQPWSGITSPFINQEPSGKMLRPNPSTLITLCET